MTCRPLALAAACCISVLLTVTATAAAGNWPNLRGPTFNGSAQANALPERWTLTDGVLWSAKLPGPGSSTPALWGDRVFLTAADAETGALLVLCLDAAGSQVLWKHQHGTNHRQGRNDMTSPSPVTDGERVVFMFGTGILAAYDFKGQPLWQRDLAKEFGTLSWMFEYGASPLLYQGKLYVQMMRRPTARTAPADKPLEPFLLALDPATGKDLWRQVRPAKALDESWESYVTPVPHNDGRQAQVVLAGADAITAHDPATGRELWRCEFNDRRQRNWRLVSTPVSDGARLYVALPRGLSLAAVKPATDTVPLASCTVWSMARNAPDVCSPLLYEGRLYVLDGDRRVLICLNPEDGKEFWRGELGGGRTTIRSSPTAADGKIYFIDEAGTVFVIAAGGETFRLLAQIEMGGGQPARSSIVIADNRLFIRTADALHCIGAPRNAPAAGTPGK